MLSDTKEARDTGALVERIQALKAAHTLEATPERSAQRQAATLAEPVTRRILGRTKEASPSPIEPETTGAAVSAGAESPQTPASKLVQPGETQELVLFETRKSAVRKPKASHRQRVTQDKGQLTLF